MFREPNNPPSAVPCRLHHSTFIHGAFFLHTGPPLRSVRGSVLDLCGERRSTTLTALTVSTVFFAAGAASPSTSPGTCGVKAGSELRPGSCKCGGAAAETHHGRVSFSHALLKLRLPLLSVRAHVSESRPASSDPPPLPPHHFPLLLQDDGLPGPLPQPQGLVMRRRHQVVSVGADGETPDLPMVTLWRRHRRQRWAVETVTHRFEFCRTAWTLQDPGRSNPPTQI